MTDAELAGMKERLKRGSPLDCAESSALIAEVEWLRAELKIAQEDLQTERRNNGQFGVGA